MKIKGVQKAIDKIRGKDKKNSMFDPVHYVIGMLKLYGIKYLVASPGTQNANFNYFLQKDNFFKCFSVVDERSASYVATGLAFEKGEPVVITCTGATASRNYLSAMTEAFYRNIPLIALTFHNPSGNEYNMTPKYLDRSVTQKDIKALYVKLPKIADANDEIECVVKLNAALFTAYYLKKPVHIDCPSTLWNFKDKLQVPLKKIWKPEYYKENFESVSANLQNKKIAIFVGSHDKFSSDEQKAISDFVTSRDAVVFCDHTSNYHGHNKVLFSQALDMQSLDVHPEVIIDIGNVTGEYSAYGLLKRAEVWRISSDGSIKFRASVPVKKVFCCSEKYFFISLSAKEKVNSYFSIIKSKIDKLVFPELKLSNAFVCAHLSQKLPKNCSLNISILNSLRNMNFFNLDESIDVNCNVGGFGIDGPVSTLVGMSLADVNKKYFGLIGDLAFFYDMNIIGNRHIQNNLRILLINNQRGEEFRINPDIENVIGDEADEFIAAARHNIGGAKNWAVANNFIYMSANTEGEFIKQIDDFCTKECSYPILFEVFTTNENEKEALMKIRSFNKK